MFAKLKSIRVQLPKRLQLGLNQEQREEGVTLIELLAVVVILGIISAVAIPVVSGAINNAKVSATLNSEGTIQVALQRYYDQTGYYPTNLTVLAGPYSTTGTGKGDFAANGNAGPYLSNQFPEFDGWSNYIYYAPVTSAGAAATSNGSATGYILLSGDGGVSTDWTATTSSGSGITFSSTNLPGSSTGAYIFAGGGSTSAYQLGSQPTMGVLSSSVNSNIFNAATKATSAFVDN